MCPEVDSERTDHSNPGVSGCTDTCSSTPVTSCSNIVLCHSESNELLDLGAIIIAAGGSFDSLRNQVQCMDDSKRFQLLTAHNSPGVSDVLHSHQVTKQGKTWKVSFQYNWLQSFPWLSYSTILQGGICRYCILFPQ